MDDVSKKTAKILLSINAVTLNPKKPYRFSSGVLSPIYTDCRILMSYPKERRIIRDLYIKKINLVGKFDLLAATATAGIPHAAWIADKMSLPMAYVRSGTKDHGKVNQIEGVVKKGQKTAVIEDLISTGESATTTANVVRDAGAKVSNVFSIITYGMKKADDILNENVLSLTTLTSFNDVAAVAQSLGIIKENEATIIFDWAFEPSSWGKRAGFE